LRLVHRGAAAYGIVRDDSTLFPSLELTLWV
jgi:hypothetical protein